MIYNDAKKTIDAYLESQKEIINLEALNTSETAVIIVDMINGFAKSGVLYSSRIENIVDNIRRVLENLNQSKHLFLCDNHVVESAEFTTFPNHCLQGTDEVHVVDPLKQFAEKGILINKNSTNGFLEPQFQAWLNETIVKKYIIMGCCTDLCVLQFALTLKTHYNRLNENIEIIVLEDGVATYDLQAHPGDFMHIMALKFMQDMGITIGRLS